MTEEQSPNAWADDIEEKEMLASSGAGGGDIKHMKFEVGRNVIRVIGRYFAFREVFFNKVQRTAIFDGKNDITETDPRVVKLREEAKALSEKLGKDDKKVKDAWKKAFEWKPALKYAINVIDRVDGQVKIWKFSRQMKEQIMAIVAEQGEPSEYDLVITRTGLKFKTRYKVAPVRDREPLTDEEKLLKPFILSRLFKATDVETVRSYMDGKLPEKKTKVAAGVAEKNEVVESPELPSDIGDGLGDDNELGDLGDIA